jgi:hypothetical protein
LLKLRAYRAVLGVLRIRSIHGRVLNHRVVKQKRGRRMRRRAGLLNFPTYHAVLAIKRRRRKAAAAFDSLRAP